MIRNHIVTNITKRELLNGESLNIGVSETLASPMLFDILGYGMTVVFPKDNFEILPAEIIDAVCLHEYGHIKAGYKINERKLFISILLFHLGICDKDEIEADREALRYTSLETYRNMMKYIYKTVIGTLPSEKMQKKFSKVLKNRYKRTLKLELF